MAMESIQATADFTKSCNSRAESLVAHLAEGCSQKYGVGSMSVTHYDTAWLAMITKPSEVENSREWLFPDCFTYVLREQLDSGAWPEYASEVDGILNNLASLLALVTHSKTTAGGYNVPPDLQPLDLDARIAKAKRALSAALENWNVGSCVHVGFEILVPSLLEYLEAYDITFNFSERDALFLLNAEKLQKFKPEFLYSKMQMTALHSLEAFIGKIDFQRVAHHKLMGSMFASPSSTAAYLMNNPVWDEESELYLRHVVAQSPVSAVPSAFPSTIFECTWTLSTLLSTSIKPEEIGLSSVQAIKDFLAKSLKAQKGVLGFVPGILPDADDTAKSLYCLQLLGQDVDEDVVAMANEFRAGTHFKTYQLERNPSFSANCNVLLALLNTRQTSSFVDDIEKATAFLCSLWEEGGLTDKWNLSSEYCYMLLTQAFVTFLEKWNDSSLDGVSDELVLRVSITLFQTMERLLCSQNDDGSWGNLKSAEVTAYAVIALSKNLALPYDMHIRQRIRMAVKCGCTFLQSQHHRWNKPDYLWVEKVSYGSPTLSEIYCIAAIRSANTQHSLQWRPEIENLLDISISKIKKLTGFYSRLPIFSGLSEDDLHGAVVEANLYYHRLSKLRHMVFPRTGMSEDKYLEHIPLTWTSTNRLNAFTLPSQLLWEMMVISMLNYQVDEYMETIVAQLSSPSLQLLETIIHGLCGPPGTPLSRSQSTQANHDRNPLINAFGIVTPRGSTPDRPGNTEKPISIQEVESVLSKYINHVLHHPLVLRSPEPTQRRLGVEMSTFLLAHITHNAENVRLAKQDNALPSLIELSNGGATRSLSTSSHRSVSSTPPPPPSSTTVPNNTISGASSSSSIINTATSPIKTFKSPASSYISWVRGTAADHTSCPFSFVFFCCLISDAGTHCLGDGGAPQLYVGQALCRHLATLCRQYNDYGSLDRDAAEGNLNSLNFPEFAGSEESRGRSSSGGGVITQPVEGAKKGTAATTTPPTTTTKAHDGDDSTMLDNDHEAHETHEANDEIRKVIDAAKADLMTMAEFERSCMDLAMKRLEGLLRRSDKTGFVTRALRLFIDVTDLYGQIYVARDIASRKL